MPWHSSPRVLARIALVSAVVVGLAAAHNAGYLGWVAEPGKLRQALLDLGPRGQVFFVLAYALLQPFGAPGTVFVFVAPLIWPWPQAFALSMVGTMAASVIGFSFARFLARDWLAPKVPPWLRAYDAALARRGFVTVAALRCVLWMPQFLHAFLGISRVGFWTHFWGSLVGYTPPLLATAYFGEPLFDLVRTIPPSHWLGLLAVAVAGVATWLVSWRKVGVR